MGFFGTFLRFQGQQFAVQSSIIEVGGHFCSNFGTMSLPAGMLWIRDLGDILLPFSLPGHSQRPGGLNLLLLEIWAAGSTSTLRAVNVSFSTQPPGKSP